jgi:hypothetical protein
MKKGLNPVLDIGNEVVCYHMEGELAVPPGTKGKVTKITKDPIVPDSLMYNVDWENGQKLPLLSDVDTWKVIEKKIEEQSGDPIYDIYRRNRSLFEHFDYAFFRNFFIKLRDSGIVNMFGSYPLVYAGREHIDRYYGEGREDDETFQELLDVADESKNKLIQGILSYMEENGKDLDDINLVNSLAKKFSSDLFQVYANSL